MADFLLCADVGNTRTKLGLFSRVSAKTRDGQLPECLTSVAIPHGAAFPWNSVTETAGHDAAIHGIVAGSNPDAVARALLHWPIEWPHPMLLDDVTDCGLEVRLEEPNKAGVDRILNAVACNVVRPAGIPAIIIDTGTATTVDAVSADGAFEGGAILPGIELCARALHQYTALLSLITVDELIEESREPLGRNTREALRGGLLWGQIGAINELATQLSRRWDASPFLLLTGGGAPLATSYLPQARWEPHLSLQGLAIVGERLQDRVP